jgi:hypothetical protein
MRRARRIPALVLATAVVVGCSSDADTTQLPATSTTTVSVSTLMSVKSPITAGETFVVNFSGRLAEIRGGYLSVTDATGAVVASLRSDGNSEIPMAYVLGSNLDQLDDGLSGAKSTFIFPPELPAGSYTLCTTNSGPTECVPVVVQEQ